MSDAANLERGYRRWLRCYSRSFRREHEAEMLTVLMAGARPDQRRPHAAECLDLLRGAVAMRLRPRVPRTERAVLTAVKLMCVGALLELATGITLLATLGHVKSSVATSDPGLTTAAWQAVVAGQIEPLAISAGIAMFFLLWLAWAYGRGKRWPGIVFALFFATTTWSLLRGLSRGSFVYAQADLAIATVLWLVELAVFVLVVHQALQKLAFARSRPARASTG
jgi:cbb3-type cytochrome oxidase subunit 3